MALLRVFGKFCFTVDRAIAMSVDSIVGDRPKLPGGQISTLTLWQ
ncbi:hypothetical protein [Microcoleus sp. CAWBG640]